VEWASQNHIILVVLPSKLTWLLQPLDVKLYLMFKEDVQSRIDKLALNEKPQDRALHKKLLAKLIGEAWQESVTVARVKEAFRATGMWPLDAAVVIARLPALKQQPDSKAAAAASPVMLLSVPSGLQKILFNPADASAAGSGEKKRRGKQPVADCVIVTSEAWLETKRAEQKQGKAGKKRKRAAAADEGDSAAAPAPDDALVAVAKGRSSLMVETGTAARCLLLAKPDCVAQASSSASTFTSPAKATCSQSASSRQSAAARQR
jgi:hypothetical protein